MNEQNAVRPATGEPTQSATLASAEPRGSTYIDDDVVSVIARIAAEQTAGIHEIGESSLRHLLSRMGRSHGVEAEVGQKEAAVDVEVVVQFGVPIPDVSRELRTNVINAVETMTGRHVVEVNVFVVDVHVPKLERHSRRNLE